MCANISSNRASSINSSLKSDEGNYARACIRESETDENDSWKLTVESEIFDFAPLRAELGV